MKKIITLVLSIFSFFLFSCSTIKQTTLTSDSKNYKECKMDIKAGLEYIFENQGISKNYATNQNVNTIANLKTGQYFSIQVINLSMENILLKMVLNDIKGKPYLTLYEKITTKASGMTMTKQNTLKNGLVSYELKRCECNSK